MMESRVRLKDRLARIFRSPSILRSSTTGAPSVRSHSVLSDDIAYEPVFIPRRYAGEKHGDQCSVFLDRPPCRSLSCRPPANVSAAKGKVEDKKKEKTLSQNCDFYVTAEEEGACFSFPSPNSSHHLYYHCFGKDTRKKKKNRENSKKKRRVRSKRYELGIRSSSDEDGFASFGSDETETFFSSRSFSSDSSEFYRRPKLKPKTKKSLRKKKTERKRKSFSQPSKREGSANGFRPLVSVPLSETEETRGGGFAVLKRTTDPYGDFRSSMVEMIMERQIFGARELEGLLHKYLSLNSPENYSAILRAFADISRVIFSC